MSMVLTRSAKRRKDDVVVLGSGPVRVVGPRPPPPAAAPFAGISHIANGDAAAEVG